MQSLQPISYNVSKMRKDNTFCNMLAL